jgi:hypothetical protein
MSGAADKICEAIQKENEKFRQKILASLRLEVSMSEFMRLGTKIKSKEFQDELVEKLNAVLLHISPDSEIINPAKQAGHASCLDLIRTDRGEVLGGVQSFTFAIPKKP